MLKQLLLIPFLFSVVYLHAQVTTWQGLEGFASDKYYTVKVNGVNVPVYDTPIASYAVFDFIGPVTVEVNTMYDVRWVDIRPLKSALKPVYSKPENISLELNGRICLQPLFIFSGNPEKEKPSKSDKNIVWFEGGKLYKTHN